MMELASCYVLWIRTGETGTARSALLDLYGQGVGESIHLPGVTP